MLRQRAKILPLAAGVCLSMAAELLAQGGLGAPPGRMSGGGARSASSGRAVTPGGGAPSAAAQSAGQRGSMGARSSAGTSGSAAPSRPTGNILFPGTPGRSSHGRILSPGGPGLVGQPSILSPGLPAPFRPGNVLTPGTPPARPETPAGRISSGPDHRQDRFPRLFRDRRGFERRGGSVVVYPYVYFGFPYSYGGGGYAVETGAVSRTSSSASYVIEGHLDETSQREVRSRVYEVGPATGGEENLDAPQPATAEGEDSPHTADTRESSENTLVLIALRGGLIYAVREHWMLGNTVHFVTLQGDHYVVSLQEVDLDLSVQLNRERGQKFVLEVRKQGTPPK